MSAKQLQARWQAWSDKFAALSRREQGMISGAALVGILMIGNAILVDPQISKRTAANKAFVQKTEELSKLRLQVAELQDQLKLDPAAAERAEIARLEALVKQHQDSLSGTTLGLVPPARMNGLLEKMLGRQSALKLLSLHSLPPESVLGAAAEKKDAAVAAADPAKGKLRKFDVYRHGVELKIAGAYADLYQYLVQLESSEQKVLWGDMRLQATETGSAILTLRVYTLSAERTWLSI